MDSDKQTKQGSKQKVYYAYYKTFVLSPFGHNLRGKVSVMVFNATFNNISVISWRLVLLLEQIGVPGKKTLTCIEYTSPDVESNSHLPW